jgi:3-phenylpropionate/cinnamic acid dioxygenase small subunit
VAGARVYVWAARPGLAIRQEVSRVLSDERQILNLLYSYCELQDAADFAGVAELFRHSGYRVHNGEEHFGYDEVHALKTAHDKVYDDETLRTKHVMTNTIIELDPDGRSARTRSYFTVYQATPQLPLQCVIAGRYHDVLEKVEGAWRFRDRYIIGDLLGDLSQHLRDNPLEER